MKTAALLLAGFALGACTHFGLAIVAAAALCWAAWVGLKELKEERKSWEVVGTPLEKSLKMLPAIDLGKLRPSPASLKQLKGKILNCPQGEEWLRTKVFSLEYADGFSFGGSYRS